MLNVLRISGGEKFVEYISDNDIEIGVMSMMEIIGFSGFDQIEYFSEIRDISGLGIDNLGLRIYFLKYFTNSLDGLACGNKLPLDESGQFIVGEWSGDRS